MTEKLPKLTETDAIAVINHCLKREKNDDEASRSLVGQLEPSILLDNIPKIWDQFINILIEQNYELWQDFVSHYPSEAIAIAKIKQKIKHVFVITDNTQLPFDDENLEDSVKAQILDIMNLKRNSFRIVIPGEIGIVYYNPKYIKNELRIFVLLHELAHAIICAIDENGIYPPNPIHDFYRNSELMKINEYIFIAYLATFITLFSIITMTSGNTDILKLFIFTAIMANLPLLNLIKLKLNRNKYAHFHWESPIEQFANDLAIKLLNLPLPD